MCKKLRLKYTRSEIGYTTWLLTYSKKNVTCRPAMSMVQEAVRSATQPACTGTGTPASVLGCCTKPRATILCRVNP